MELERLKIDRGETSRARRTRRSRGGSAWRWLLLLAVLAGGAWLFQRPLSGWIDRLRLPKVAVAVARRTSPLAASAVAGTAANGYVVARNRAALSADTPGRIVEMNVEEGSVVEEGDVVARLFSDEFRAALRQAEAQVVASRSAIGRAQAELKTAHSSRDSAISFAAAARARLAEAKAHLGLCELDLRRAEGLVSKGAGTQQAVDQARTDLERAKASRDAEQANTNSAEAQVAESEARLGVAEAAVQESEALLRVNEAARDLAAATLDKTEVRAPFDGIVVLKDAEVGEVVSPNSMGGNSRGSVVTMVDFSSLEAQVDLPETSLGSVSVGANTNIYLNAFPEKVYRGRVERIWPTANRQKATVEIRVGFLEPDTDLRPEMGVRVVFSPDEPQEAPEGTPEPDSVVVPLDCIVKLDGREGVFLIERDRVRWQELQLGAARSGRVVVEAGLEGGETLVKDAPADLADGDRVLTTEEQ